ncbi:hypothetical protein MNV49_001077 [Pseudohyphozyma bogoriensis]|nr:hypothetical protein MNV49_001077 [Pseudohyphozyma bogoriensis]
MKKLRKSFSNLWDLLSGMERVMTLVFKAETSHRITIPAPLQERYFMDKIVTISPHLSSMPMLIEASLLFEAERICKGSDDPEAAELVEAQRKRFVTWLKPVIQMFGDPQFTSGIEGNHARALLLSVLDLAPNWIELAAEAARQDAVGEGPYSACGLTWNDLKELQNVLSYASTVFARSSKQYQGLCHALSRMNIGTDSSVVDAGKDALAESIVGTTLVELDAFLRV